MPACRSLGAGRGAIVALLNFSVPPPTSICGIKNVLHSYRINIFNLSMLVGAVSRIKSFILTRPLGG